MLTVPEPFKKDILNYYKYKNNCNRLNNKYIKCLNDYIIGGNTKLKCNEIYLEFISKCGNNKN